MSTKLCQQCKIDKPIEEFYLVTKAGKKQPYSYCKSCVKTRDKCYRNSVPPDERRRRYRVKYANSDGAYRERDRKKRQEPKMKEWHKRYARDRYRNDPIYQLTIVLRSRVLIALRGTAKESSTLKLLGCSVEALRSHLESLFQPGMSWANYGTYRVDGPMTWHIDHILPCASFDLTDPAQQRACFHWTNMQPLWAVENLKKSDSYHKDTL